jgi:hypothetical protein
MRYIVLLLISVLFIGCASRIAEPNFDPSSRTLEEVQAFLQPGMTTEELRRYLRTTPVLVGSHRFHWVLRDGSLWTDFEEMEHGLIIRAAAVEPDAE